jgi:hypothetical protein
LVSDIPAGDGKTANLFLQCTVDVGGCVDKNNSGRKTLDGRIMILLRCKEKASLAEVSRTGEDV